MEPLIAYYSLLEYLPSYDFFSWLVQVKAAGAVEVVLDRRAKEKSKYSEAEAHRRFESILLPGAALAGLPCREESKEELSTKPHPDMRNLIEWIRAGNTFERLRSVIPVAQDGPRFTMTLRRQWDVRRNSNEIDCRKFADRIGAMVIEDFADDPIPLHERVALYAGASMNYGIIGGPLTLCTLTSYPVCMFVAPQAIDLLKFKIKYRRSYPWCLPNQHLIWEHETFRNLMAFHRTHFPVP